MDLNLDLWLKKPGDITLDDFDLFDAFNPGFIQTCDIDELPTFGDVFTMSGTLGAIQALLEHRTVLLNGLEIPQIGVLREPFTEDFLLFGKYVTTYIQQRNGKESHGVLEVFVFGISGLF